MLSNGVGVYRFSPFFALPKNQILEREVRAVKILWVSERESSDCSDVWGKNVVNVKKLRV